MEILLAGGNFPLPYEPLRFTFASQSALQEVGKQQVIEKNGGNIDYIPGLCQLLLWRSTQTPAITSVPTHTVNITGLRNWRRGFSLVKDCPSLLSLMRLQICVFFLCLTDMTFYFK